MYAVQFRLFGKFSARCNEKPVEGLHPRKVQELLCYLLLHRNRTHPRETLAGLLWGDSTTARSKKYLRQALWQLQLALRCADGPAQGRAVLIEAGSVRLDPGADLWLDVAAFEKVFASAQGIPGELLEARCAQSIRAAVALYQGDLLEGWYQDWCLYERERLQNMYLLMLGKLMDYSESHGDYETGLSYGESILRRDRAHERTHQRMMRLEYLSGDRAGALRQYERCVAVLREELGVRPSKRTVELVDQIRADQIKHPDRDAPVGGPTSAHGHAGAEDFLGRLGKLRVALVKLRQAIERDIQAIEQALTVSTDRPSFHKR